MGDAVVSLLDSPMFAGRRKILVGFSQGGYMSYRMVLEHPHVFDAAILMSPSFKGEESTDLTGFDSPHPFPALVRLAGPHDSTCGPADRASRARGHRPARIPRVSWHGSATSTRRSATSAPSSISSRFRTDRPVPLGPSTPPSDHPSHTSRTRHRPQSVSAARVAAVTRRGCVR